MFSHEGPARTARSNGLLAGYLAFVAGFTNASGLILLGAFTSHVTGNVGRLSVGLVQGDRPAAATAALFVALFLCGAVVASLIVETYLFRQRSASYGAALLVEGLLLSTFAVGHAGGILSFCMGMQNSLVTRLSGSVVRTTHVTGVVTDLGIGIARWMRWLWSYIAHAPARRSEGSSAVRPNPARSLLFLTITFSFAAGGLGGAVVTPRWGFASVLVPAVAILVAATYAFATGARREQT